MFTEVKLLELMAENAELRAQLAEVQELCVELAVDAGELHTEIKALQHELAEARAIRRPDVTRTSEADRSGRGTFSVSTAAVQPVGL